MTATLQQMLAEPKTLLDLARSGEEVVLTDDGAPVVRLTGVAVRSGEVSPKAIARHANEANTATNDGGDPAVQPTGAIPGPRKASPEALRDWMQKAAAAAAAGATGKLGMTSDEIIDDLRSERC